MSRSAVADASSSGTTVTASDPNELWQFECLLVGDYLLRERRAAARVGSPRTDPVPVARTGSSSRPRRQTGCSGCREHEHPRSATGAHATTRATVDFRSARANLRSLGGSRTGSRSQRKRALSLGRAQRCASRDAHGTPALCGTRDSVAVPPTTRSPTQIAFGLGRTRERPLLALQSTAMYASNRHDGMVPPHVGGLLRRA
jgi:hypothetical protein